MTVCMHMLLGVDENEYAFSVNISEQQRKEPLGSHHSMSLY